MGQKVNPIGFRTGVTQDWRSRWYAKKKDFSRLVIEDFKIRKFVKKNYGFAGIPRVEIERRGEEEVVVVLHVARPGVIIGRKGAKVDQLKSDLEAITGKETQLRIVDVTEPDLQAQLVAEGICEQLAKRAAFRRIMKKTIENTMSRGAQGIKILISGRLAGSEMARRAKASEGKVPLQTLRADIDYGFAEAATQYGNIGVKVWIYRGLLNAQEKDNAVVDAQKGKVQKES